MKNLTLDLPAMYGDHHVVEVRRILLNMPGVKSVYASSCFQAVEITYDPAEMDEETLIRQLDEAGYLHALATPLESETPANIEPVTYFRHTAAYRQTGKVVGFAQNVPYLGRPLWPCPGMVPIQKIDEGE
ncbi:MAG: heavy-metal-associated domain-containing protein [Chloroflexi bacterium]|nr:heavy-metal-associated domain-containing protein [Chloroflexota bacterium]